jgi:hypothetical protein
LGRKEREVDRWAGNEGERGDEGIR